MEDTESSDSYYLAGEYDPVEGTIVFAQGVLEKWEHECEKTRKGDEKKFFIKEALIILSVFWQKLVNLLSRSLTNYLSLIRNYNFKQIILLVTKFAFVWKDISIHIRIRKPMPVRVRDSQSR